MTLKGTSFYAMLGLALAGWVAIAAFATFAERSAPKAPTDIVPAATVEPVKSYDSSARQMCKEFLTRMMHDPSSADFGDYWNWTTIDNKDGTWSVGAKYRAKNGYGAIRSEYTTCVMRRSGDDWTLIKAARMR